MHSGYTIHNYDRSYYAQYIACIEGFYADGYPYAQYLDADCLDQKLASGDFILTVALNDKGTVVSTVAAERMHGSFEGAVLLLLRNVRKECRGTGIASEQLNDLLLKIAERFPDAVSIYADVMTHDAVSQNSLVHRGYTLSGLRLMVYDNAVMVPRLHFEAGTKMTQAIYCMNLKKTEVAISLPEAYRAVVETIYQKLNVVCSFGDAAITLPDTGRYTVKESNRYRKTEFIINRVGLDLKSVMERYINRQENYTFVVYVDMNETCTYGVEILKLFGFYFSGIMPLTDGGEYLLMVNTDNCNENFSQIVLSEGEKDFLETILSLRNDDGSI